MKKTLKMSIFVTLIAVFVVAVRGQDEVPIRVNTNLVNLNVTIVDATGNYVEGLKREQFEILDNGIPQEISHFSSEEAPISFGIVYDMHPTTSERTKTVLDSLRNFTGRLRQQDDFYTLVFNPRGSLILDFVPTTDQINTHLAGKYGEPNALYDAIFTATQKLRDRRNLKRVLLVITDSADHHSEHRFNEVLDQFKTIDAKIYTVLWDEADEWNYTDITSGDSSRRRKSGDASRLDQAALQDLSLRTGGVMQAPTSHNIAELIRIFDQIAFETRQQYAFGFYPSSVDGNIHNLIVRLRSVKDKKRMVLTYRPAYHSAKAQ